MCVASLAVSCPQFSSRVFYWWRLISFQLVPSLGTRWENVPLVTKHRMEHNINILLSKYAKKYYRGSLVDINDDDDEKEEDGYDDLNNNEINH